LSCLLNLVKGNDPSRLDSYLNKVLGIGIGGDDDTSVTASVQTYTSATTIRRGLTGEKHPSSQHYQRLTTDSQAPSFDNSDLMENLLCKMDLEYLQEMEAKQ